MSLCNPKRGISPQVLKQLAELIVANSDLTAENEKLKKESNAKSAQIKELSRKNEENQQEVHKLKQEHAAELAATSCILQARIAEHIQSAMKALMHVTTQNEELKKESKAKSEQIKELSRKNEEKQEVRTQQASLAVFLQDLTSMLIILQNEAENLASSLREAQEPAETRYRSEHSLLLKQMKKMHSQLHATSASTIAAETKAAEACAELKDLQYAFQKLQELAEPESVQIQKFFKEGKSWQTFTDHDWEVWVLNPSIQGTYFKQKNEKVNNSPVYKKHTRDSRQTPLYIVKNNCNQWHVVTQNGFCLALDPECKILPLNCDWHASGKGAPC
jgi:hypothetical protein